MSPVELADGRGGGCWDGAKSYDGEKAWSSIIHSILSERRQHTKQSRGVFPDVSNFYHRLYLLGKADSGRRLELRDREDVLINCSY